MDNTVFQRRSINVELCDLERVWCVVVHEGVFVKRFPFDQLRYKGVSLRDRMRNSPNSFLDIRERFVKRKVKCAKLYVTSFLSSIKKKIIHVVKKNPIQPVEEAVPFIDLDEIYLYDVNRDGTVNIVLNTRQDAVETIDQCYPEYLNDAVEILEEVRAEGLFDWLTGSNVTETAATVTNGVAGVATAENSSILTGILASIKGIVDWVYLTLKGLGDYLTTSILPFILIPLALYIVYTKFLDPILRPAKTDTWSSYIRWILSTAIHTILSFLPFAGSVFVFMQNPGFKNYIVGICSYIFFGVQNLSSMWPNSAKIPDEGIDARPTMSSEQLVRLKEITKKNTIEDLQGDVNAEGKMDSDAKGIFCNLFSAFTGIMLFKKLPMKDDFLRGIASVTTAVKFDGVGSKVWDMFAWGMKKCPEFVKNWVYYVFGHYPGCINDIPRIKDWITRVLFVREWNTMHPYDLPQNSSFQKMVTDVFYEGIFLRMYVFENKPSNQEYAILREQCNYLQNLFDQVMALRGSGPVRQCPVGVYIYGDSFVGKTTVATKLATKLYPSWNTSYYNRTSENAKTTFWDGYKGEPVLMLDDFMAAASDEMVTTMLNLISPQPCTIPMASLDNANIGIKGSKFVSKVVIATSNLPAHTSWNGLKDLSAFRNRMHICLRARVIKHLFQQGAPADYQQDCSHIAFDIVSPYDGEIIQAGLTMDDVTLLILQKENEQYNTFKASVSQKVVHEPLHNGFAHWLTHQQIEYVLKDTLLGDLTKGIKTIGNFIYSNRQTEEVLKKVTAQACAEKVSQMDSEHITSFLETLATNEKEYNKFLLAFNIDRMRVEEPKVITSTFGGAKPCFRMKGSWELDAEIKEIMNASKEKVEEMSKQFPDFDREFNVKLAEEDKPLTSSKFGQLLLSDYDFNVVQSSDSEDMDISPTDSVEKHCLHWKDVFTSLRETENVFKSFKPNKLRKGDFSDHLSGARRATGVLMLANILVANNNGSDLTTIQQSAEFHTRCVGKKGFLLDQCEMTGSFYGKIDDYVNDLSSLFYGYSDVLHSQTDVETITCGIHAFRHHFVDCFLVYIFGEELQHYRTENLDFTFGVGKDFKGPGYKLTVPLVQKHLAAVEGSKSKNYSNSDKIRYAARIRATLNSYAKTKVTVEQNAERASDIPSSITWPKVRANSLAATAPRTDDDMIAYFKEREKEWTTKDEMLDKAYKENKLGIIKYGFIKTLLTVKCFAYVIEEVYFHCVPNWLKRILKAMAIFAGVMAAVATGVSLYSAYMGGKTEVSETKEEETVKVKKVSKTAKKEEIEMVKAQGSHGLWRSQMYKLASMLSKDINSELPTMTDEKLQELVVQRVNFLDLPTEHKQDIQNLLDQLPIAKVSDRKVMVALIESAVEQMADDDLEYLDEPFAEAYWSGDYNSMSFSELLKLRERLIKTLNFNVNLKHSYKALLEKELSRSFRVKNIDVIQELSMDMSNYKQKHYEDPVRHDMSVQTETVAVQGASDYDRRTRHQAKIQHQNHKFGHNTVMMVKAQARNEDVISICDKLITVKCGGWVLNGIPLRGNAVLIPKHLFMNANPTEGTKITVIHNGVKMTEYFNPDRMKEVVNSKGSCPDAVVYLFGANMCGFKGCLQHFITDEDILERDAVDADLISKNFHIDRRIHVGLTKLMGDLKTLGFTNLKGSVTMGMRFLYDGSETHDGDCGGVLIDNDHSQRPILGMHVHVNETVKPRRACATVVTKQQLEKAMASLSIQFDDPLDSMIEPNVSSLTKPKDHVLDTNLRIFGSVPKKIAPFVGCKTNSQKSPFFEKMKLNKPCTFGPAPMTGNDERINQQMVYDLEGVAKGSSPLERSSRKIGIHVNTGFKVLDGKIADMYLQQRIIKVPTGIKPRMWTMKEAINGVPGEPFGGGIEMTTSEGYPWMLGRPKGVKGKQWLFTGGKPEAEMIGLLEENVTEREVRAQMQLRTQTIWMDYPKDEIRELGKVEQGKLRKITAPPIDYTLLTRKYFGEFCRHFYSMSEHDEFSAVGVNVYSPEWSDRFQSQCTTSMVGKNGDYGAYEFGQAPEENLGLLQTINAWYKMGDDWEHQHDVVRRVLWNEKNHRIMMCNGILYYSPGGCASGGPMTVIDNTWINMRRNCIAWRNLVPRPLNTMYEFERNVDPYMYGDDDRTSVVPKFEKWFNAKSFSDFMSRYNISYTPANKLGECSSQLQPLEGMDFLKCKTGYLETPKGSYFVPLFSLEAMNKTLNFVSKGIPVSEAVYQNMNSCLLKISMYGRNLFNNMRADFVSNLHFLYSSSPSLVTYDECIDLFNNGGLPVYMEDLNNPESDDEKRSDKVLGEHFVQKTANMQRVRAQAGETGTEHEAGAETVKTQGPPTKVPQNVPLCSVDEPEFDVFDMVEREQRIDCFEWSTKDPVGAVYRTYSVPWDLLKYSVTQTPFQNMLLWRGTTVLSLDYNATRFHSGMLRAVFVPLSELNYATQELAMNRMTQTLLKNVKLNACEITPGRLEIPFIHPKNWLNAANYGSQSESLGHIVICVFNQLNVGDLEIQTVPVTIKVSFKMSHFRIPRNIENIAELRVLQGQIITKNYNMENAVGSTMNTRTADSYDQEVSTSTGDLDKPNVGVNPMLVRVKALPVVSHGNDVEYSERMNLNPGHLETVDISHFGIAEDEMDLNTLKTKKCFCRTVQWDDRLAGQMVASGMLSPTECVADCTIGDTCDAPLLDYISSKFHMWSGSIVFSFEAVLSQLHTGILVFCVHYGTNSPPKDLSSAMSQYYTEISFHATNTSVDCVVPFRYPMSQCRVGLGKHEDPSKYVIGCWSLWVYNKLMYTSACASKVDVNIYIRGGNDFKLTYLGLTGMAVVPVIAQAEHDTVGAGSERTVVGKGSSLGPCKLNYTESYSNFKNVARRFVMFEQKTVNLTKSDWSPTVSYKVSEFVSALNPTGILSFQGSMYRGWRGTIRVKFIFETKEVPNKSGSFISLATWVPEVFQSEQEMTDMMNAVLPTGSNAVATANALGWSLANETNPYHELEIPFVTPYNFLVKRSFKHDLTSDFIEHGTVIMSCVGFEQAKIKVQTWVAGGDNFRMGVLFRVPRLHVLNKVFFDGFTPTGSFTRKLVEKYVTIHSVTTGTKSVDPSIFVTKQQILDGEMIPVIELFGVEFGQVVLETHPNTETYFPKVFTVDLEKLPDDSVRKLLDIKDKLPLEYIAGTRNVITQIGRTGPVWTMAMPEEVVFRAISGGLPRSYDGFWKSIVLGENKTLAGLVNRLDTAEKPVKTYATVAYDSQSSSLSAEVLHRYYNRGLFNTWPKMIIQGAKLTVGSKFSTSIKAKDGTMYQNWTGDINLIQSKGSPSLEWNFGRAVVTQR